MKYLPHKIFVISFAAAVFMSGCASSKVNRDIDARLQAQPDISSFEELGVNARKEIKDSNLLPEKKAQLLQLQRSTQDRSNELRRQSFKLRALLVQDLTAKHYDADEVAAIKDRLKKIEDQRLQLIYTAVDQASGILGRDQEEQNARILRSFDFEGRSNE